MYSRKSLLDHWESLLLQSGVDSPRLSAQVLLSHILGIPRMDMLLDMHAVVPDEACRQMQRLCSRRSRGEPVAYLTGFKEFYGLDFEVDAQVLVPRPETELIIDDMRRRFGPNECLKALDLGTGSGVLAVTCAAIFPCFQVTAVDISAGALRIARRNAQSHAVGARVSFVQGDLSESLRLSDFDVVMANLPYVPLAVMAAISSEVVDHEPHLALFSGPDGLNCYRRLALCLAGKMKEGAMMWCEIDSSQGAAMKDLFSAVSKQVSILKDYAGHDRIAVVVF